MAASYEPLLELGHGGMGTVSVARASGEAGFERLVVIKRMHAHLLDEQDVVERFVHEAQTAAWVQHANVVSTHHVGSDAQGYYLVLEYIEGASVEELVDRAALKGEQIPPPIVLRIALDVLAGLHAVHTACDGSGRSLEILHRDISLQNVLVGRDGVARVADFGIAKSVIGRVKTDNAYLVGKLLYLPPEYLTSRNLGRTLDVYSLGITLWMALSGQELFREATEAQLITSIVAQGVPPLSSVMQVPPRLDEIVARACARDPRDRFATAREMADAIETLGRDTGWLGSHAEVAEYVERMSGKDLEHRRALIAERLASPARVDRGATTAIPLVEKAEPAKRAWPKALLGAAAVAILLGVGFVAWQSFKGAEQAQSQPEPPQPPAVAAELAPVITPSTASAEPIATAAPTASAPEPEPATRPIPKRSTKPTPPEPSVPVRPPDDISKTNPYQR